MAEAYTEQVHVLILDDDELELVANLLFCGPRLGHGYYSDLAADLADKIVELRGEIEYEDRLFDPGDEDGHVWVRTEPR
jgi:hypothetical protein